MSGVKFQGHNIAGSPKTTSSTRVVDSRRNMSLYSERLLGVQQTCWIMTTTSVAWKRQTFQADFKGNVEQSLSSPEHPSTGRLALPPSAWRAAPATAAACGQMGRIHHLLSGAEVRGGGCLTGGVVMSQQ